MFLDRVRGDGMYVSGRPEIGREGELTPGRDSSVIPASPRHGWQVRRRPDQKPAGRGDPRLRHPPRITVNPWALGVPRPRRRAEENTQKLITRKACLHHRPVSTHSCTAAVNQQLGSVAAVFCLCSRYVFSFEFDLGEMLPPQRQILIWKFNNIYELPMTVHKMTWKLKRSLF